MTTVIEIIIVLYFTIFIFLNHRKYTYTGTFSKLQISSFLQNLQNSNKKLKTPAKNSLHCYLKYEFCNFFWKPQNKGFYIQKDFFALNGGTFSLTMHTPTTKQNRVLFIYIRYLSILPYSASMLNIVRRKWMKITLKGI